MKNGFICVTVTGYNLSWGNQGEENLKQVATPTIKIRETVNVCMPTTTPGYSDHFCMRANNYTRLPRPLLHACQLLRLAWDPKSGNSAVHNGYVFPYKDNLLKTYPWINLIYSIPMSQPDLQKTSLILSSQMTHYCIKLTTELTTISNF